MTVMPENVKKTVSHPSSCKKPTQSWPRQAPSEPKPSMMPMIVPSDLLPFTFKPMSADITVWTTRELPPVNAPTSEIIMLLYYLVRRHVMRLPIGIAMKRQRWRRPPSRSEIIPIRKAPTNTPLSKKVTLAAIWLSVAPCVSLRKRGSQNTRE